MTDLLTPFIILTLVVVIIVLLVDRHFIIEQSRVEKDRLLEELSRAIKAVISKNANDYVMTTSIDKVPTEQKPQTDPDLVLEDQLTDEEFIASINKQAK